MSKRHKIITLFLLSIFCVAVPAVAEYTHDPINQINPAIFKIDEKNFIGSRVDPQIELTDSTGARFKLGSLFGKPLILVLAYFECDGVCSRVNMDLKERLAQADGIVSGKDYRVLTVSFDKNDTTEKAAHFAGKLALSDEMAKGWRLATMDNKEDIKTLTQGVGYNYFWSKTDRIFIHPNVFIFISPEGLVTRYLYGANVKGFDIEVAVAETGFGRSARSNIKNISNLLLIACYSYNFKEGSYLLNYPLFIAVGSLVSSISLVVFSILFYRKKRRR